MGDSLLHQAYPTIEDRLSRIGVGATIIGGPSETLMTRQATWLDDLERSVTEYDPDVVILESCCGTGNPWLPDPYVDADGTELEPDSAAIWAEWERLALAYTEAAQRRGALVLWILGPAANTNGYYGPIEDRIGVVNRIYTRVAACSGSVGLVDWGVVGGTDQDYVEALPDANGKLIRLRADDGLHFTEPGQALLADLTRAAVEEAWAGRTDSPTPPCVAATSDLAE
ncbi:MAG: hypothetical protein AAGA37_18795 [Actinomycetota bacterium]